jgi:hypothetical protein
LPEIRLMPPAQNDPNNRMMGFVRCVQGDKAGCASAGAWLAAHAQAERKLQVCLHADELQQCLQLEAVWHE